VIRRSVPTQGFFVYHLLLGDEVIYVGKSKSILSRLGDHARNKAFTEVILHECDSEDEMNNREAFDIHHLSPVFNKAGLPKKDEVIDRNRLSNRTQSPCPNCLQRVYPSQYMIIANDDTDLVRVLYRCNNCDLEFDKYRPDLYAWELRRNTATTESFYGSWFRL
jgi:hypothetical protein